MVRAWAVWAGGLGVSEGGREEGGKGSLGGCGFVAASARWMGGGERVRRQGGCHRQDDRSRRGQDGAGGRLTFMHHRDVDVDDLVAPLALQPTPQTRPSAGSQETYTRALSEKAPGLTSTTTLPAFTRSNSPLDSPPTNLPHLLLRTIEPRPKNPQRLPPSPSLPHWSRNRRRKHRALPIPPVRLGHDAIRDLQIHHVGREGSGDGGRARGIGRRTDGDAAVRGFEAEEAAEGGRDADGAAAVVALACDKGLDGRVGGGSNG